MNPWVGRGWFPVPLNKITLLFFPMSSITNLDISTALSLWNKFIVSLPVPAPFAFNPSLFNFYQTFFHWKPYYFLLYSGGEVVAVLPLVNTGRSWVSLPHFSYGGFVQSEKINKTLDNLLFQKLITLIKKEKTAPGFFKVDLNNGVNVSLVRQKYFIRSTQKWRVNDDFSKVSSIIHLPDTKEEMYVRLNGNLRRKLNKSNASEFEIRIGEEELLEKYYELYVRKMHKLGSPCYGKNFFKTLLESWRFGEAKIFLVLKNGKVTGAAFLQSYLGFYENTWFATDEISYKQYVSDYQHWQMIQYAIEKNSKVYSFGRSTPLGSVYYYKNHWPVDDLPIYQYAQGRKINIRKHPWFHSVWKELPSPVIKKMGPLLIKHIY